MVIDCPRCRRVLDYSGDRPSFCAYCGVALPAADAGPAASSGPIPPPATDPDPGRTAAAPLPLMAETAEYRPFRPSRTTGEPDDFPERISVYRLIRKLGSGGMGTVFEAEDEVHARRVAIKLIGRDYAASGEAVDRFRREGRLASAVTHPRCVFVLAVDHHLGRPYIVMELMPGTTLQTLVEKGGPLDPAGAIVKIFDVIEGLQEFHKRGLIHRDVKPSNCFLEAEGRVKIGDFGLSKSLEGDMDLTRSGTFIGTPLYASPEQIKRDLVDERTDVYSVAATLYYLLCGQPPVQAKDAAEALARIASEPAPPLRSIRPELPRALEAVVLRGLERDPARRWRSLQEFHDALVPFVPDRLSIAGIGLRIAAYLIDVLLSYLLSWAVVGLVVVYYRAEMMSTIRFYERNSEALGWIERGLWFLYFLLLEGMWGASLGKWIVGLQVSRVDQGGPPGILRGLIRVATFYALTELPADLWDSVTPAPQGPRMALRTWFLGQLIAGAGYLALCSTMRHRNGFRGPHEWLSGTRVVRVGSLRRLNPTRRFRLLADSRSAVDTATPAPEDLREVGPYVVRRAVRWEPGQHILIAEDSALERPVWIVMRESTSNRTSLSRRALNRRSRPRWIGGGEDAAGRWEAFTAPVGVPLSTLVSGQGLGWRDVLPILRQLTEELRVSLADGTMPDRLSPEQVWIQPDGTVQLVDSLGGPSAPQAGDPLDVHSASSGLAPPEPRVIEFLGEVARLGLEGHRGGAVSFRGMVAGAGGLGFTSSWLKDRPGGRRIRAAVPDRAALLLDRLTGVRPPFASLEEVAGELDLAAARPMEVNLARRAVHLSIQAVLLLPGLILMFLVAGGFFSPRVFRGQLETIVAVPLLWAFWAFLSQGGYSLPLVGISLVRSDGRRAGRLACLLRALVTWAVPTALLVASHSLQKAGTDTPGAALALWMGALVVVVLESALGLLFPRRGLHDWLAGTELVPY